MATVVARAQSGDRAAARTLLERAVPLVKRWAHGRVPAYVRHEANTEDVLHDAVIGTLRGLSRFQHRTVSGLQYYLRRSVVNRIRDLIRGARRRPASPEVFEDVRDDAPSPVELAIREQRLEHFLAALQHLPPADRQLLVYRIKLGYTAADIAEALGISVPAAGMRLTRALEKLRKALRVPVPGA